VSAPPEPAVVRPRRSLRLDQRLDELRASGGQILLSGPAVHDLFIDPDQKVVWLPDLLRSWCKRHQLGFVVYRLGAGAMSYPTLAGDIAVKIRTTARPVDEFPEDLPEDEVLCVIADLQRSEKPAVLVIDYVDLLLPEHDEAASRLERARLVEQLQALTSETAGWQAQGLQLVLIDRGGGVSRRLATQPGIHLVTLDPPDAAEATLFLQLAQNAHDPTQRIHLGPNLSTDLGGRLAGGLLLRDLDDERVVSSADRLVTASRIVERKVEVIRARSNGTLDVLDSGTSMKHDVAGMHGLRLTVENYLSLGIRTLRVALCGPTGTGKTHSASAIANRLGVPMVSFGQVLGEFLGQSERNMRNAWSIIHALAPVVVFIDEADQGLLGARDGSAYSGNEAYGALRAMMFHELGEPFDDNGISVVITMNRPTRLDARTQSRFTFVPVLWAAGVDLAKIMQIHARKARITIDGDPTDVLTAFTDGGGVLSGRSAQEVFTDARVLAARQGREAVTPDDIAQAVARKTDSDWTTKSELFALESLCHPSTPDALPWAAALQLGEEYQIPGYLRPYVDDAGVPNLELIRRRLVELEGAHGQG
jgi:hypothetical protein